MRSSRCGATDHSSDAFGLARDGKWHCWACDSGGDLLKLLALGEGLDIRSDFSRVLELAAKIAGVDDEEDFGGVPAAKPAPRERPPAPPVVPLADRITLARRRAAWVWPRLCARSDIRFSGADIYLAEKRLLDPAAVRAREEIRDTPMRCSAEEAGKHPDLKRLAGSFSVPGMAIPVRSPIDGALVDIRIRRLEPRTLPDGTEQPKIVGMLGGVTTGPAETGQARTLVGCYGRPHAIDSDLVIVVEGMVDYLTALVAWPNADVLGAVDAGSMALVAGHAARALAARDDESRLVIVEQNDAPNKRGERAADRTVNEDPNAATKVATRILGPRRLGWLFCDYEIRGEPGAVRLKDLNDLYRARAPLVPTWWTDLGGTD